ncbi:DinB family protein [Williamsia sp. CHRR-6]|uniref:DinB family protein n=1 Tax=Williamsia sp. CHRR-6 TaxID=2835871 RepID=UPI001BD9D5BA|nr:DinB family protein [Williamsia sp. CHRR-6]MBT0566328.1 DinB family protein [Williamsia sp. CHRR-6]
MIIAAANVPRERETLIEIYGEQRRNFLWTLKDISEDDARRVSTVSKLTLGGLVKHLTNLERYWIATVLENDPDATFEMTLDTLDDAYTLLDGESLEFWLGEYRDQARLTDEFIATVPDLDALIHIPPAEWATTRQQQTVRRILFHLFRETAQHSGHADIIREAIDGQNTTHTLRIDGLRTIDHSETI